MSHQEELTPEKQGMSSTTKWILGMAGALIIGAGLAVGGLFIGQGLAARQAANTGYYGPVAGRGMMSEYDDQDGEPIPYNVGPGTMGGRRGMMGGGYPDGDDDAYPYHDGYGMGPGMMGGGYPGGDDDAYPYYGYGMGPGMMGGANSGLAANAEPLTVEEAESAIEDYLAAVGNDDLKLGEVMIFENHAYGQIVEESTGIGAMEVLVDPLTQTVYPEYGPNMMWNTKYGPHAGGVGGPGMMGGRGMRGPDYDWQAVPDADAALTIDEEEAVQAAQDYLDAHLPGAQADEHADPFYGYYTLHVLRDGEVTGMLSVNGYTGDVWLHTWHGDFVEMAGH